MPGQTLLEDPTGVGSYPFGPQEIAAKERVKLIEAPSVANVHICCPSVGAAEEHLSQLLFSQHNSGGQ
ncbi:hypothetical protein [Rhizobium tibeticum]|uniref:hypothetical protein n=1 Tax=Rhizobium tibeticum TaxID=501024 RepID=UPI000931FECF|nr:hypothetical protein [Rhizobium tibeticum]